MIVKGYYLSSKEWSYPEVVIDYFLEDIQDELNLINVKSNIERLENYRNNSSADAIVLALGKYTLDIQGSDEATSTIRGLKYFEYLLENSIEKK